jgi:molybdopterin converting factor subunit 1
LNVDVRLFASYREKTGMASTTVEVPASATVGCLAEEMVSRYPEIIDDPGRLIVAVNHEYKDHLHCLKEGDEVALIPPVSGG